MVRATRRASQRLADRLDLAEARTRLLPGSYIRVEHTSLTMSVLEWYSASSCRLCRAVPCIRLEANRARGPNGRARRRFELPTGWLGCGGAGGIVYVVPMPVGCGSCIVHTARRQKEERQRGSEGRGLKRRSATVSGCSRPFARARPRGSGPGEPARQLTSLSPVSQLTVSSQRPKPVIQRANVMSRFTDRRSADARDGCTWSMVRQGKQTGPRRKQRQQST